MSKPMPAAVREQLRKAPMRVQREALLLWMAGKQDEALALLNGPKP